MKFVELKCRSNFTFLTGASHPEELVERAVELGLGGIALTDRSGVYGIPKAYRKAKHHPDFKFITGAELVFEKHPELTLLAQNREAYGALTRLLTLSHHGKEKGKAFLRWDELTEHMQTPASRGLVVLAPNRLDVDFDTLKSLAPERLYLLVTKYLDGHDRGRFKQARDIQKHFEIPFVASNDVYFHVKERKPLCDVLTSIREGKSLEQTGFKLLSNAERYLKSPQAMQKLFKDYPEAIENTVSIAESCTFSPAELRYRYPSEWIPSPHTAQSYLEELVWRGCFERYKEIPTDVEAQLRHELNLIKQLSFADYFLTIYDIVSFARSKKILCQGRGSAANSAVCYVLGITAVDPVRMNLLFERFISAERGEPPDIDVDFEHERREEVIQYVYEKYGRHRAAMVSAVVTYKRRSAFREVAKAFGIPVGTLSAKKVERQFESLTEGRDTLLLKSQIETLSDELEGFPRHLSIHSGGFTLSADPIIEIVPVEPARMEGRTIIQWDKYDLDELGLLKVDLLSLGMLSALRKTLDLTGMQLHEIPAEDPATYEMIQRADTVGTFQIESRAQMSMLGRLLPKTFYDLVVEVAIVRPGPIVGQMVHPYLKRRRGLEKISFPHPKVRAILEKTLGVPLFQEQIMKLAIDLAHFTPGEADELRRSIAAWRSSRSIEQMGRRLMEGLLRSGMPQSFADQMFQQIQGFSQYGFPESHAASFALIAYASSYMKCHFPAEFTCSLINSQPMGFYSVHTLVSDAVRHGVTVLPVDPNHSQWDCTMEGPHTLRLGFRVLKGFAKRDFETLSTQRQIQPFVSLIDFLKRNSMRRDVLHRFAMAEGFKSFHVSPRDVLWKLLEYEVLMSSRNDTQLCLFRSQLKTEDAIESLFRPLSLFEKVQEDFHAFELSTHGHPMAALRQKIKSLPATTSEKIKHYPMGRIIKAAGLLIVRQRPPTAKGVTFSTLEDEHGFLDLILHGPTYDKYKDVFLNHCFVIVTGVLQKDANTINVLVQKVEPIWDEPTLDDTPLAIEPIQYFH